MMESIDAYSNSDLVWLLFGYRTLVKSSAIVGTYLCYHGFRALREKRVAEILNDAAQATVNAARLAAATPHEDETTLRRRKNKKKNDESNSNDNSNSDEGEEEEKGTSSGGSNLAHVSVNLILASLGHTPEQPLLNATTLRDDDDINLVRRVNLGLDPQYCTMNKETRTAVECSDDNNGIDEQQQNSSNNNNTTNKNTSIILAETSITDFPLLTARRSLTSFLDFLNPGQIVTEAVATLLECIVLLNVSRVTLGCIAPDHGDSRYGELVSFPDNKITNVRSWEVRDDQSNFSFNLSIVRRWARRFAAAPPVALRKVFGELSEDESFKTEFSGSLVAKSLLGGILYRDAVGISALKFPIWLGCLVTPMCVRFAFVESDLQKNLGWQDIRSIAAASALRSLCYSAASVFQESWVSFWRARRIRRMEKKIALLQSQLHVFDDTDENFIVPSQELTVDEAREKTCIGYGAKRSGISEHSCCSQKFLPANLFSGFLLSDSAQTQVIAALSNAGWAFTSDLIGFSAMVFMRKYTFFKPSSLRAEIAVTCSRMVCQLVTLSILRMMASKMMLGLNFLTTSKSTTTAPNTKKEESKSKTNVPPPPPQSPIIAAAAGSPTSTSNTTTTRTSTSNKNFDINDLVPLSSPSTMGAVAAGGAASSSFTATSTTTMATGSATATLNTNTKTTATTSPGKQHQHHQSKSSSSAGKKSSSDEVLAHEQDLFVNPLRKTVQARIGTAATPPSKSVSASSSQQNLNKNNNNQQQQPLSSPAIVPNSPAFFPSSTQLSAASPPASPATQLPHTGTNTNPRTSLFPESPPIQGNNKNNTSALGGLPTPSTMNTNNSISSLSEEQKQRRRLLADLDKAFGNCSALVLSHTSDAVHSMLPALSPDNNVRIHCLLYLHAVDEYVAAVGSGEIQRNHQKIYAAYQTPVLPSPRTAAASSSSSSLATATTNTMTSTIPSTATSTINTTSNNAATPTPSSFFFNIFEHRAHIHTPSHVFTGEEISHRKALAAASTNGSVKPFHCVACKYTFRENYKALVLPCGHLVHENCGTRMKSDWCPRCIRPFEKPTSSDRSIRQYHEAHARFKDLTAMWTKHVLLPAHLWFAEWRRIRQYITHKCDEDKLWHEMRALELEKIKLESTSASSPLVPINSNNNAATTMTKENTMNKSSSTPNTPATPFASTLSSSNLQPTTATAAPNTTTPPAAAAASSSTTTSFKPKFSLPPPVETAATTTTKRRRLRNQLNLITNVTWAQHLVESQIVFTIPDDFAPSGYGLSDVPIVAALNALGVLAVNREHERTVAMIHETMVDGKNGSNSMTSGSRIVSFGGIRC